MVIRHHDLESDQIRSFFLTAFPRIWTECGGLLQNSPHSVQIRENTDQKKLRIWTLFVQCTEHLLLKACLSFLYFEFHLFEDFVTSIFLESLSNCFKTVHHMFT